MTELAVTEDSPLVDVSDSEEHEARSPSPGRHRYTGPELSALLNQVRRELGAEASIVEANRVRSGGIGGFFTKESFEVVAAPAAAPVPVARVPADPPAAAPVPAARVPADPPAAVPVPAARVPADPPAAVPVPVPARPVPTPNPSPAPRVEPDPASEPSRGRSPNPSDISIALLERAEAISALERVSMGRSLDDHAAARHAGARNRFGDVLEAELASESSSTPETTEAPAADLAGQAAPDGEPLVVPELAGEPATRADAEAVPAGVVWEEELVLDEPGPLIAERAPTSKTVDVPSRPAAARGSLMMVIGNVGPATSVARGLIAGSHTDYAELAVVAREPGAIDVSADRIGPHYEAITRHLVDWTVRGESGIVVVDAVLGTRLRAEVECLRNLGADSIVVVDDRRAPAIETLRLLDGVVPIEGTIVVSAPAAGEEVRRDAAHRSGDSVSGG